MRPRRVFPALIDAGLNVTRGRPLEGEDVGLRVFPWALAGVLGFLLLPLLPGRIEPTDLVAAGMVPVIIAAALLLPWRRLPAWTQGIPPLVPFVMIALVRSAHVTTGSAYTPVALLPVLWFALYGTRGQLLIAVIGVGVTFAIPTPAVGGDAYPLTEPAAAALWMVIAGITGFAITELSRERERLEAKLGHLARTDALTSLPNRRAWDEELARELARAERNGEPLCVALLDLDHFKAFNDRHGHQAGDEHLKATALEWRARLRAADLITRYGGEEFAVILPATVADRAVEIVERLRASVPLDETVSSGIAEWDRSESGAELVARADQALYEAKRAGRDRAVAIPS
jgi:diguanylate cyclase (GGDEF)-like protein